MKQFKMYLVVFLILLVNQQINTQTISLEYVPNRPFHHPRPGNYPTQIIPPGQPWPDSPAGYTNFSQTTKPPPNLADRIKEKEPAMSGNHRPSFHPNPGSSNVSPIIPPGKPWPANPQDYDNFSQTTKPPPNLADRIKEEQSAMSGNHRPSFHPNPGSSNVSPIIPPGKPWPDSPAGYTNFSQTTKPPPNLADRIKEEQSAMIGNHRPSFHPNPGSSNVSPIVPPGKPWPANPQDYGNFSQTTKPPPDVVDRFTEGTEEIGTSHRPSFHPNPGSSNVNPIIPPGKPWPASQEGYNNFSQINTAVRIDGTTVDMTEMSSTATEKTVDDNDDDGDDEKTSTQATELSATPTVKQIITEAPEFEPRPIDFIAPIREPVPGFFQIFQARPSFDFSYRWNYFGANPQPIIPPILPAAPQFPIIIPVIG